MAFFKFRFPGHDDPVHRGNEAPHESLEALRKRVKHRLIGSGVLVLIAVIGFPLVFDTQPRPVGLDIPIDIPDKAKTSVNVPPTPLKSDRKFISSDKSVPTDAPSPVKSQSVEKVTEPYKSLPEPVLAPVPSTVPAPIASASSSLSGGTTQNAAAAPKANASATPSVRNSELKNGPLNASTSLDTKEEIVSNAKPPVAPSKPTTKETNPSQKEERYIIQVGAYTDEMKVKDIREKLEKAGLHTYTQVVEKDGKKIRIRIGPFTSKEEANRQLQKVRGLNLQPNLLTL